MAEPKVIKKKPSIAINKFLKGLLYSVGLAAITYGINFISQGGIPPEYAFLSGVGISILQALKKGLEPYKPELDA
jgi:hypothetical protein